MQEAQQEKTRAGAIRGGGAIRVVRMLDGACQRSPNMLITALSPQERNAPIDWQLKPWARLSL